MKRSLKKVYEPDEGKTHITSPPGLDQVTLCGITDWLTSTSGDYGTDNPVDCWHCEQIFKFCNSGKWPK